MAEFLVWQHMNLISPTNILLTLVGIGLITAFFYVVYSLGKRNVFLVLDRNFLDKFLNYWLWALIQQLLVLTPFHYASNEVLAFFLALAVFSIVYHIPNWRLMTAAGVFAAPVYGWWFFLGFQSFIYLAILHALGGTFYHRLGWDMKSYRFAKRP